MPRKSKVRRIFAEVDVTALLMSSCDYITPEALTTDCEITVPLKIKFRKEA
jgi:hypothetical protein